MDRLQQLPLQIILTIWASAFFGFTLSALGVIWSVVTLKRMPPGELFATLASGPVLVFVVTFLAIPTVMLTAKFMNYRNTRYRIAVDGMELEEGFLTLRHKRISLRDIREVSLQRGILQRLAGLGSVYVATIATGGADGWRPSALLGGTSMFGSGAMLMDLEDYDAVYRHLQRVTGIHPAAGEVPAERLDDAGA